MMPVVTAPAAEAGAYRPTLVAPAGSGAPPAPAVRTRRVTGRQLMGRLRADALLDDRLSNARALPLGARPVLEAVAELVAASPEPGVYRPDPELDGPLCEQIARRLDFHGGEAEVEGHFAKLVRARLLLVGEGDAIIWPVAVPNAARGGGRGGTAGGCPDTDTCPLDTGGRPRRHETKEQARERRLAAQRAHGGAQGGAQRSMTLVIAGGGGSGEGGAADRNANLAAETSPETSVAEVRLPREVSALSAPETLAETPAETFSGGFEVSSRAAAAVSTREEINTKESDPAAAAAESQRAREAVAAKVCAGVSGKVSPAVSPEVAEPAASRDVEQSVELIVTEAMRLHGGIREMAPARITARHWLVERGLTVEGALEMLRREGQRAPGTAPIRSLRWFDNKLPHYLSKQRDAAVPATAEDAAPKPVPPEIAARPEWARQPVERQMWLKWALDGWALSGEARRRKLSYVRQRDERAWALFAAAYPEAWEVIGVEPPAASP